MYKNKCFFSKKGISLPLINLISLWEVTCDYNYSFTKNQSLDSTLHKNMISLIWTISGECEISFDDQVLRLKESEFIVLNYTSINKYTAVSKIWTYRWFNFYPINLEDDFEMKKIYTMEYDSFHQENIFQISNLLSTLDETDIKIANLLFTTYYLKMVKKYAIKNTFSSIYSSDITEAKNYISVNFDKKLNIAEVAEKFMLSERYFRMLFTKINGLSPKSYQLQIRMEKAKNLLIESSLSISQISQILGYESQFYFSRDFKKFNNCSPLIFRKKNNYH